jgi:hypothetical protein
MGYDVLGDVSNHEIVERHERYFIRDESKQKERGTGKQGTGDNWTLAAH